MYPELPRVFRVVRNVRSEMRGNGRYGGMRENVPRLLHDLPSVRIANEL